jgi:hypothetical protein
MKTAYQGRSLWTAPRPRRRGIKPGWIVLAVLLVGGVAWAGRDRLARTAPYRLAFLVPRVAVEGSVYLGEAEVRKAAGLDRKVDFLRTDLKRARRRLLANAPRVESARVERAFPRRIVIRVVERRPIAVVRAGRMLETDGRGVILPALVSGVLPDVPVISGVRVADARAGRRIADPRYERALRHLKALARPSVALPHPVSQVDVTGRDLTVVTLAPDGVDVFLPQEPPDEQMLSALRVVLGDLASRGQAAATIDLTGREIIAVRPLPAAASAFAPAADSLGRPSTRDPRRG